MRHAAEAGLKLARLVRVDSAVGGRWADRGAVLDADLMARFPHAAVDQVSVYYENKLRGTLRRELAGLTSS